MTNALYNATKFDDQLYSKQFETLFNQAKANGLIDRADARQIEKYRTDRVVELYNQGKGKYFVGREFRPDLPEDIIAEQHTDIKADLRNEMDYEKQRLPYELKQMGYDPEDYARFVNDRSGVKQLPIAGQVEVPFLSKSFRMDPLKELGIGMYQAGRITAGIEEGSLTPFEAIGRRVLGRDPGQALQETGNPLIDSGQIIGESAVNRAATLPYGVLGSRLLTPGSAALFGAASTALGNAIGGAKMGARFGVPGAILGGVIGGIAGMVGGSYIGEFANEKIADVALGRDANAQLKATRESLQTQYPFAARAGEEAPDLAMFGPSFKVKGFSGRKALSGIKQAGLPGVIKGVRNQNEMIADLGERFGEGAMNVVMAARQSDREKANGGPGKTAWDILAEGAMGVVMQGETRLGKTVYGGMNAKMDNMAQAALTRMAKRLPVQGQQPVQTVSRMPEGMMRINLGGRLESAVDAQGNPVIRGARYAVYDPKQRKASIYTDNDFALAGERTKSAAFSLGGTDNIFRRNPILTYSDKGTGTERMILGITRDAGVVVRDIDSAGKSQVSVVPVGEIRNEPINKRIVESMASQGVRPNPAPAPFMPDVFTNADKSVFPDTVSLDSNYQAIPARVISKLGGKATNAYMVALPDGTHIRVNGAMINTKGAEPLVRGKISEEMFPQSLSDLMPQRKPYERHVRIGEGDTATHIQLSDAGFGKAWRQVSDKFADARKAILREPDPQKREIAIDMLHNQIANEIDKAGLFTPSTLDIKPGSVIKVQMPGTKQFSGSARMQDAIVVGKNKYGHEVVLPYHQDLGTFTVHDADIDPASALMASMEVDPGSAKTISTNVETPAAKPVTKKGATLQEAPAESEKARYVDYQTQPDTIRKKIDEAVGALITSDESPIGKTVEVNDASGDTHIHARVTMHNPGRITYHLRTTEFDPASRAEKDQYVTTYEALYDPDKDEWSISSVRPDSISTPTEMDVESALWNLGDISKLSSTDYSTWLSTNGYKFKNKTEESIALAGFRFATFLQSKFGDQFIKKDTKTVDDLNKAAKDWYHNTFDKLISDFSYLRDDASLRRRNYWQENQREYGIKVPVTLVDPSKLTIDRWLINPRTGQLFSRDTEIDVALIPRSIDELSGPDEEYAKFSWNGTGSNFLGRHVVRVNAQRAIGAVDNAKVVAKAVSNGKIPAFVANAILVESLKTGFRTRVVNGTMVVDKVDLTATNDAVPAILNATVLNGASKKLMEGTPAKDALRQAYTEWITKPTSTDKKNGWLVLPQSKSSSAPGVLQKLTAGTQWCVGRAGEGYDSQYRAAADFHIYFENGRALIGIGKSQSHKNWEINGDGPDQSLTPYDELIVSQYIGDGKLPGETGKFGRQVIDDLVLIYKGTAGTQDVDAAVARIAKELNNSLSGRFDFTSGKYVDNIIDAFHLKYDRNSNYILRKMNLVNDFDRKVTPVINNFLKQERARLGLPTFLKTYLSDVGQVEVSVDPSSSDMTELMKYDQTRLGNKPLILHPVGNDTHVVPYSIWSKFENTDFSKFKLQIENTDELVPLSKKLHLRDAILVFDKSFGGHKAFYIGDSSPRNFENFNGEYYIESSSYYKGSEISFKNSYVKLKGTNAYNERTIYGIVSTDSHIVIPPKPGFRIKNLWTYGSSDTGGIKLDGHCNIESVFNFAKTTIAYHGDPNQVTGISDYYGADPMSETTWQIEDQPFAERFFNTVTSASDRLAPGGNFMQVNYPHGFAENVYIAPIQNQVINIDVFETVRSQDPIRIEGQPNASTNTYGQQPVAAAINIRSHGNDQFIKLYVNRSPSLVANISITGMPGSKIQFEKTKNNKGIHIVEANNAARVIYENVDFVREKNKDGNFLNAQSEMLIQASMLDNTIRIDATGQRIPGLKYGYTDAYEMLDYLKDNYYSFDALLSNVFSNPSAIAPTTKLVLGYEMALPIRWLKENMATNPQTFSPESYKLGKALLNLFNIAKSSDNQSEAYTTRIPELLYLMSHYRDADVISVLDSMKSRYDSMDFSGVDLLTSQNSMLAMRLDTRSYVSNGKYSELKPNETLMKLTDIPNYPSDPKARFLHFMNVDKHSSQLALSRMYDHLSKYVDMLGSGYGAVKYNKNVFKDPVAKPNSNVLNPLNGEPAAYIRSRMQVLYNLYNLRENLPYWQWLYASQRNGGEGVSNPYANTVLQVTDTIINNWENSHPGKLIHNYVDPAYIWYATVADVQKHRRDYQLGRFAFTPDELTSILNDAKKIQGIQDGLISNVANDLAAISDNDLMNNPGNEPSITSYAIPESLGDVLYLAHYQKDWAKSYDSGFSSRTNQNDFPGAVPYDYLSHAKSYMFSDSARAIYNSYAEPQILEEGALFQTNDGDSTFAESPTPSERPKQYKRKAFFSARIPTGSDFKSFYKEYARIEQQFADDPAGMKRELNKLYAAYKDIIKSAMPQILDILDKAARQERPMLKSRDLEFTKDRKGYVLRKWEGQDLTALTGRADLAGKGNPKEIHSVLANIAGNNYLVNVQTVSNSVQLASVLREQYKFDPDAADGVAEVVDRFARAWALEKVKAQTGRSLDLTEITGKLAEDKALKKRPYSTSSESLLFKRSARTEPEILKATAEYMREFYRERFAAFGVIDQAHDFDAKYKGAIFRATKSDSLAFNIIVGFASRDQSTGIHEIAHALLRSMTNPMRAAVIKSMMAHNARVTENTDAEGNVRLPVDIEEMWATAFEASLMRNKVPVQYGAYNPKAKNQADPTLVKVWRDIGEYLRGTHDIAIAKLESQGKAVDAQAYQHKVQWYAPLPPNQRLFKKMGVVAKVNGVERHATVMKAQTSIDAPIEVLLDNGQTATIQRADVIRLGGWTGGFNEATLDVISNWLGSYYADTPGKLGEPDKPGHRTKMETSFPELFADYDAETINLGQISGRATEAARYQEVTPDDVHQAVSAITPMSMQEYSKLVDQGVMPKMRDGRYLNIDKQTAIARANVASNMAVDGKPNWSMAVRYVPTLGDNNQDAQNFGRAEYVTKSELVQLAKLLDSTVDPDVLFKMLSKTASDGVPNAYRVFYGVGKGAGIKYSPNYAPTLAAMWRMRQDGLSLTFSSGIFSGNVDRSFTETYITPDEFDAISEKLMGIKYSNRDVRRLFNDLNIIPHLVRDKRNNNYAFLPQHVTILKIVAEARKQQVETRQQLPLFSGQTYTHGPSWARIKDYLVKNGDFVTAYNYIVNHPQYISKGRELTLTPLTQHEDKRYFHSLSYEDAESNGLFQTNEPPHPSTKIASLSSDAQIRTALSTIIGQGRVQFDGRKITSVLDRNGNVSNVHRMLTTVHGYDQRTALGLYAMTETADFKKWSGSHPIIESMANEDIRPSKTISELSSFAIADVRKYLAGKAVLAVLNNARTAPITDSDVESMAIQLQDYYRSSNHKLGDLINQINEMLSDQDSSQLVAFQASLEKELRGPRYDSVRSIMAASDDYANAAQTPKTGKGIVTLAMDPDGSAAYLRSLKGYVLPSGTTSMDGNGLTANYIRLDNPQVKDMKGKGITTPQVEAMLDNAIKAKRDGLILLNVNHTIGGNAVLHNVVIPRNKHTMRPIDVHPKVSLASYFSGAGLLEVGSKTFAVPALAVEYDAKIARVYAKNHGNHVLATDVLSIDPESLKGVQWFHASPVCTDVSNAKTVGRIAGADRSTDRDRDFARAVARVIKTARPPIVTIENTEAYARTSALKIITDALEGYTYDIGVYNAKDYGAPTDRKRLFVRAMLQPANGVMPPVPGKHVTQKSWMDAIQDILPSMPVDLNPQVNTRMSASLKRAGMDWNNVPYPVLVQQTQNWIPRGPDKPAPTIVASDGQLFRVVMPGGLVYKLNKDAVRRLQGLPDDFILPDTHSFAQKIIGNGIPPQMTHALVSPLVKNHISGRIQAAADGFADAHEPALFNTAYDPVNPNRSYKYVETNNDGVGAPYYVERITPRSAPTTHGRLWNVLDQINDISRLVLSGDLAFASLQAGIIGLSNPRVGIKAFWAGLHGFAPNLQIEIGGQKYGYGKIGREVFHKIGDGMRAHPLYAVAREAGLPLSMYEIDDRVMIRKEELLHNIRQTHPEATIDDIEIDMMDIDELGANDEWYMKGRFTQHMPTQGQFERFNVIMHDTVLLTQFDNWTKVLLSKGYEPGTEKFNNALKDAARILAVAIGDVKYSTDTQKDATASRFAKVLFTAPRWLMSRALIDPFWNPIISNTALFSKLREVMGEDNPAFNLYAGNKDVSMLGQSMWLRLAGAQLALIVMALIYQNWNPDVEVDLIRNPGRVRVGDFRIDPVAGQFDHAKLAIRMVTALLSTDQALLKKAEREHIPLWLYQIKDVSKELQYKMSPMLNTAMSMLGGNDYEGIYNDPFGSALSGRSLSVVGTGYFSKSDTAQNFYEVMLKPSAEALFGKEVANNLSISNAVVERLPTLWPQMFDAMERAMDYDRPVAAYVLANTIPNWLGFKVEVAPAEELKNRIRRKNAVTPEDSPTILKLLKEGKMSEVFTGTNNKVEAAPWIQ